MATTASVISSSFGACDNVEDGEDFRLRYQAVCDGKNKRFRYVVMFLWLGLAVAFFCLMDGSPSHPSSVHPKWMRAAMIDTFRKPRASFRSKKKSSTENSNKIYYRLLSSDLDGKVAIDRSTEGTVDSNIFSGTGEIEIDHGASNSSCPRSHRLPAFRGKKGIAMGFRTDSEPGRGATWQQNLPKILALGGHWNYRWALTRNPAQPDHLEFVPMVWGGGRSYETLTNLLQDRIKPYVDQGVIHRILGFNEPDHIEQANMSVERAVELWPAIEQLGIPIVSPSCVDPLGPWMLEFMRIAEERCLRVDWIGVHWYGGVNPETFKERMREVYRQYQRPLIITEFAPADWNAQTVEENRFTPEQALDFAKQVLPWLESTNWIAGYSWGPFRIDRPQGTSSALFDANGELTALGRYYAQFGTKPARPSKLMDVMTHWLERSRAADNEGK